MEREEEKWASDRQKQTQRDTERHLAEEHRSLEFAHARERDRAAAAAAEAQRRAFEAELLDQAHTTPPWGATIASTVTGALQSYQSVSTAAWADSVTCACFFF